MLSLFVLVSRKYLQSVMNASSDGLEDLETLFGFWIEGIILPIVAGLGIAGDTLICHPSL